MSAALTIGFLGAGKMATALAEGFLRAGLVTSETLVAYDIQSEAGERFGAVTNGTVLNTPEELVNRATVIVLAVKPDQIVAAVERLRDVLTADHLLISIAAGVKLQQLEAVAPAGCRVVRVMPNTPALVGACAAAYAVGGCAQREDGALTGRLFSAVGVAVEVKEALLDAVTGLSGSGPAYGYLMIEALSDGGVAAGLPRDVATRLAAQTLMGAARMVLETGRHPGELKDMVTSPGGTTIEGLHELEKAGLRNALISAVRAAARKSRRLGRR
ncbi:MAG: pyrroline-5-carboxylate reductase [Verrucomicrobiae bacterium]|nr:pyrroline-5-carboxylate reductase [Verrucomicrobiae bacterium]MCP5520555.1 pyrroline-5-carboxylate reductase [Verrucomicrobiales bacterium]